MFSRSAAWTSSGLFIRSLRRRSWEIAAFNEDFQALFRYYRNTVFVKFMLIGPHLHMKMRIGKSEDDFKTFKWRIKGDGTLEYLGNRSDHECRYPEQVEFQWKRAHRDMHRGGRASAHLDRGPRLRRDRRRRPHHQGRGQHRERAGDLLGTGRRSRTRRSTTRRSSTPIVGPLIILRILPYRETAHRHLVYQRKDPRGASPRWHRPVLRVAAR